MSEYNPNENPSQSEDGLSSQSTGQPQPTQQPEQPTQYWSSQDARRSQQGGVHGYGTPHSRHVPPPRSSYSPGSQGGGYWQQQYQRPEDRGEWSFDEYDKPGNGKKKKKNRGLMVFGISLLSVLFVALIALSGMNLYYYLNPPPAAVAPVPERSESRGENSEEAENALPRPQASSPSLELSSRPEISEAAPPASGLLTTPQVAQKMLPSVVSVENFMNGYMYEAAGLGSGIIMSTDGYILTNAHVVEGADALKVTLDNGDPYEAKLIGADKRTDLAVIKINAPDLVAAEFGDSDLLEVGEVVIAIGNPATLELKGSVTQGIVSAINREINTGTYSMTFIQTDAAINPGNSGGALCNQFGQVIGVNSSKIVATGYEGIGFAIPISDAKPIIDDLIEHGRVRGRVMLGITAQPVDEVDAKQKDIPMGLMIRAIDPESDLSAKGGQVWDIITHINDQRVYTFDDLRAELDKFEVGSTVKLTLYRQSAVRGTTFDVTITLMEDMG